MRSAHAIPPVFSPTAKVAAASEVSKIAMPKDTDMMDQVVVRRASALPASPPSATASHPFVPLCIAEQCFNEAKALVTDEYTSSLEKCAAENFGPCAGEAWDCLGDENCRSVLTCAPKVVETCKTDFWKMVTDPAERDKLMCLANCMQDGKIGKICALEKCGKAAAQCLLDSTCRHSAECAPKALASCSFAAVHCVFGKSRVCRQNLQCLGHGVTQCGAPTVNMLTDSKIANFITCAGTKCPHPVQDATVPLLVLSGNDSTLASRPGSLPEQQLVSAPGSVPGQLLCMAKKCHSQVFTVLGDQDTKDALTCAFKADAGNLCPDVWKCLGDKKCSAALNCWSKPLDVCGQDVWHVLTDNGERNRIEHTTGCLRKCVKQHADDFVQAFFCFLDQCGADLLSCSKDSSCKSAVKCLPETVGECAKPSLDAYIHQDLFKNSVKCLGQGLETCGRGVVSLLQDQNIAHAAQCLAHCTRPAMYPMPTPAPPTPAPTIAVEQVFV